MEPVEIAVIGAGVVGLAVARALALAGREVAVLEAEGAIGTHASSRNSEVIHAGIYYPPGSLKARLCVAGRRALYAYCAANEVACKRPGKLIVATGDEEVVQLERLHAQAEANGVGDLRWLDGAEARSLEPELQCVRALWSPSTGIVDSHGLMAALRRDAVRAGAALALAAPVLSGRVTGRGVVLSVGGSEPSTLLCSAVVNAAGLFAPGVARTIEGLAPRTIPDEGFAKGHYFVLAGRAPFSRLVYPVPVPGGLGIHLTLDLEGQARFGPDVSWQDGVDYSFDEGRAGSFYPAIRRYWPGLAEGSLRPGYTGIRAKLGRAGSPAQDFVIQGEEVHGVPGLVCLYGIESPGLTASLALAAEVRDKLCR
jgi:L-2-hydroxyglutarate oxidase LhgO